jgi:hypothetical protein
MVKQIQNLFLRVYITVHLMFDTDIVAINTRYAGLTTRTLCNWQGNCSSVTCVWGIRDFISD